MSTTIDERVVEMRFDNKQFENNVQTSLSTLDRLKKSLNLSGAAKGFENIDNAAKRLDLSGIGSAVEAVRVKFSAFEVMAVTALANITNAAVNAGANIVSALTIDPVMTGFQEYETQINAVQTILANTQSKGTTLDQVNSALDELNRYADMTIYNFTEMTRNIGTFTAAGVDLDTSVQAIKGISNLAAVSGSTSQQASTAMYQLSQALAAGTVKLTDWNSVVNAGMGGQVFQDALKETARVHGIAIDQMIEEEGSFRETLSQGWLTSDILTETLAKFTGDLTEAQLESMGYTEEQIAGIIKMGQTANDAATKVKTFSQLFDTMKEAAQSGWAQTWELIIGDFEEAKSFLTDLSDMFGGFINDSANARNELLKGALTSDAFGDMTGRELLIESLMNSINAVVKVLSTLKSAWQEVFPPMTSEGLYGIIEALHRFSEGLTMSDETAEKLSRALQGLFSVVKIVADVISGIFSAGLDLASGLMDMFGEDLLNASANFGDLLVSCKDWIESSGIISETLSKITQGSLSGIGYIRDWIKELTGIQSASEGVSKFGEIFTNVFSHVASFFTSTAEAIRNSSLLQVFQSLWNVVSSVANGIKNVVGDVVGYIGNCLANSDFESFFDIASVISVGGIGVAIMQFIQKLKGPFDGLSGILKNVTGILDQVRGCFEAYQAKLNAGTLLTIASAIGILALSLITISSIDPERLSSAIGAITMLFAELVGAFALLNTISISPASLKTVATMVGMAASISILAGALKTLSDMELGDIAKGLAGIAGLSVILTAVTKQLSANGKKVMSGATQLVIFAAAIKLLVSSVSDISDLSWEGMAKGLVGVGALMAEISLFLNTAKFGKRAVSTATGITIMAAALKILASVCKDFSDMQWDDIGKGLAGIAGLLTELTLFTNLTGNAKHVLSTGTSLVLIAASIKIFASAISDLSLLSWEGIGKGLAAMGGALAGVAVAVNLMPKNMLSAGTGLVVMAASLEIIASVLGKLDDMSWEGIAKGLVAVGASLVELGLGLKLMKGTASGSAALLVAASALLILTPVLKLLGGMSWEGIAKGLAALAGAFVVLGVAGAVLSPLVPAILGLSGALTLMGVGIAAAGVGLLAFGAGIASVALALASIVTAITGSGVSIANGIAEIATGLAMGVVEFARVIKDGAPDLAAAFVVLITEGCNALLQCIPQITQTFFELLVSVLDNLSTYIPQIADSLFNILVEILNTVASNIPELIQAAGGVIGSIFTGIASLFGDVSGGDVVATIKEVGGNLLSSIGSAIGGIVDQLGETLSNFANGVGNAIGEFFGNIAGGFASGASNSLPEVGTNLSAFMSTAQPFFDGVKGISGESVAGVSALASAIMKITAADLLESIASFITGGSSMEQFGESLSQFGTAIVSYSNTIASLSDGSISKIEISAQAGQALVDMATNLPNTGGILQDFLGEKDLSAFSAQLTQFGSALVAYSSSVSGIDEGSVEKIKTSAEAGQALIEMTNNLSNSGGIVQDFFGEKDLGLFSTQLSQFGEALVTYSSSVSGIDDGAVEKIKTSAEAGEALIEMTNNLSKSGGIVQDFFGEKDLGSFAEQLSQFGKALSGYSDSVSGIDGSSIESIKTSTEIGAALIEMANTLPDSGGVLQDFFGGKDMGNFGENLKSFGESLSAYSMSVADIDADVLTKTTNAADALVTLNEKMPTDDGSGWFSDSYIGTFGSNIKSFGEKFADFYNSISGIDGGTLSSCISSMTSLMDLVKNSAEIDTSNIGNIGDALKGIGEALTTSLSEAFNNADGAAFSIDTMILEMISGIEANGEALSTAFDSVISSALTKVTDRSAEFNTAGTDLITELNSGMESEDSNFQNGVAEIVSASLSKIQEMYNDFSSTGQTFMTNLTNGVQANSSSLLSTFVSAVTRGVSGIRSYYNSFYSAGVYLVQGFANGISANTFAASARAAAMASAAASAARRALDEHSPSKVGYQIGDFFGIAFVNAIDAYKNKAYKSGFGMANLAKEGLSNAISKISDVIDNGFDSEPIIRPVLDLSAVRTGAGTLTTLLTGQRSIGVMANINAISSAMSNRQHIDNSDVVSAIKNLRKDLNNRSMGDSYVVNGITYDDGSNVSGAVKSLIRAAKVGRRV